jgi:hypothetical protein
VLRSELATSGELPSATMRYIERITRALEKAQSENVTLRDELAAQGQLLGNCQNHRKGRRVSLKGKFVLSVNEVLGIARETEANSAREKHRQRLRQRSIGIEVSEDGFDMFEKTFGVSGSDRIVLATNEVD